MMKKGCIIVFAALWIAVGVAVLNAPVTITVEGYNPLVANDCGNGTYWAEFKVDFDGIKNVTGKVDSVTNLEVLEGAIYTNGIIAWNLTKYYGDAMWVDMSTDANADYNGTSFQLKLGSWPNKALLRISAVTS